MKRRPISLCVELSLVIMFFLPTTVFSITRDEIISEAETFETHTWNATANNVAALFLFLDRRKRPAIRHPKPIG